MLCGCADELREDSHAKTKVNEESLLAESEFESNEHVLKERPWKTDAPVRFTDANGWVWERHHKIEYSSDYDPREEESDGMGDDVNTTLIDPSPDPFKASDYEYGYYYRPLADFDGWEYHLSDESITKLGAHLRSREIARQEGRQDLPNLYEAADSFRSTNEEGVANSEIQGVNKSFELQSRKEIAAKIIGTDDREPFNAWAGTFPLSVHGAMYNYGASELVSLCTVFKAVSHYSAATAAHCLYDTKNNTWRPRRSIQFKAGLITWGGGDVPPRVTSTCYSRVVNANYISHPNLAKNDYAALIFNNNGSANCALNSFNFGYVGWKSVSVGANFASYFFGYPSEAPLPAGWPSLMTLSYSSMTGGIGQTVVQPNVVKHQHDSTGGQSGTALLSYSSESGYQARAIHKGEASGNNNKGREFNGTVADWIQSYVGP